MAIGGCALIPFGVPAIPSIGRCPWQLERTLGQRVRFRVEPLYRRNAEQNERRQHDKLRDKAYPAAGLHRTSIIESLPRRQI